MLPLSTVGGLASGLDTNGIIAQLMDLERIPIQRLEERRARYEARDEAWQAITTRVSALSTATATLVDRADWDAFAAATSTDDTAVAVSAVGATDPGTVSFTVDRLARNHQVLFDTAFSAATDPVGAGDLTITVDGVDHVVTTDAATTLADLAQRIDDLDIGVSASIISTDGSDARLFLTADETGSAAAFAVTASQAMLSGSTVVQQGEDAQLTLGSGTGAVTLTRASNTFTDLLAGVEISLQATTATPVTVSVGRDIDGAVEKVRAFVDEINATLDELDSRSAYDANSDTAAPLTGDATVRRLTLGLRDAVSGLYGAQGSFTHAGAVGISLDREGRFTLDETKLRDALGSDFDGVADLFTKIATSTDGRTQVVTTTSATQDGTYDVVITQGADVAVATSAAYTKPNADTTFQIVAGTTTVDVTVAKKADIASAIQAIADALDAAGVTTIAVTETTVNGDQVIELRETRYGSAYGFTVSGDPFGLAGTYAGQDIAGTIGGETATGTGFTLTATAGDPDGLSLKVSATAADVAAAGGSLAAGSVTVATGVAARMTSFLDGVEGTGGLIDIARDRQQSQIDLIDERIERMEERLDRKELALIRQFTALEESMNRLAAMGNLLGAQLTSLLGAPS